MSPSGESANLTSSDPSHVRAWLAQTSPKMLASLDQFELELRLGRLTTSSTAAARSSSITAMTLTSSRDAGAAMFSTSDRRLVTSRTLELLKKIIGGTKWKSAAQLLLLLRGLGRELHSVGGFREPAIGNVVRRIMAAVREEALNEDTSSSTATSSSPTKPAAASGAPRRMSLQTMLWATPQPVKGPAHRRSDSFSSEADSFHLDMPSSYYAERPDLKQAVMEAIAEISSDLEDMHKNIDDQATAHVHADEVILTYGRSKTVEMFLKAAAKKRKFQVVVCEGAPHFGGRETAKVLAGAGIDTILVNDSATFALMARVNKVLLPAHAVLANGGLIAPSGSNLVALAAKSNSVPVVVVTGMFKLCPLFPHEGQDTLNDLVSPCSIVEYAEMNEKLIEDVEFINPVHDYISPSLINLYVTNIGAFQPSYIYRLLAEHYHADDWKSFEE